MHDTSNDAAAAVRAAIKQVAPIDRLREALVHSERMRELSVARLRARYPDRSTLELVELLLGERLTGNARTR
jgi:DNA-binding transcriptional regulator WhiA